MLPPPARQDTPAAYTQIAAPAPLGSSPTTPDTPPHIALSAGPEGEYQEPLFFPGDAARHERYGVGRVVSSRIVGEFELVEVDFASPVGRKMLEAKLTRLEKIPNGSILMA
jgi:hypothetical protein